MRIWAVLCCSLLLAACATKKENTPVGVYVGQKAPELIGANPSDSIIKLSALEGKLVLIDFWASWCPPCRRENRNLIKTVEHFKEVEFPWKKRKNTKGLHVFNVSMDSNKMRWQRAINQDQLYWPYHISDLQGWGSKFGQLYQVRSIPSNFLIDAKGVILARNLRGKSLDDFLENYRVKKEK